KFKRVEGVSIVNRSITNREYLKALPTAPTVCEGAPPRSEQTAPEPPSKKFAEFELLLWTQAMADLLRTSGQFLQAGVRPNADRRSVRAPMIVTQTQLARTEVDRPTSGDRPFHATLGRFTAGVSPASLGLAYADWAFHLAASPGKWQQLGEKAARKAVRLATYAGRPVATPASPYCIEPLPQDHRFRAEAWRRWPFNVIHQAFLLNQQWWHSATTGIGGVSGAPRASRLLRHKTIARRRFTGQFHCNKSGSSRNDHPRSGAELGSRRHELLRGLGACGRRQTAAWSRGVPAGPDRCGIKGPGSLLRPTDRAHPVCSRDG